MGGMWSAPGLFGKGLRKSVEGFRGCVRDWLFVAKKQRSKEAKKQRGMRILN
jgi:hypothetical protein